MPPAQDLVVKSISSFEQLGASFEDLVKRVNIPINSSTPPALVAAIQQDPFSKAGRYGLGWIYFGILLICLTTVIRVYHLWADKLRTAMYREEAHKTGFVPWSAVSPYDATSAMTDSSTKHFFPPTGPLVPDTSETYRPQQVSLHTIGPVNKAIALFRWFFYRPIPGIRLGRLIRIDFPSMGVLAVAGCGLIFCILYCFLPRPLYYSSMAYGSPPLAVRAGMLSVALLPWIVATASKANFISFLTGIGHERLIVLHRWAAYLSTLLALIHAVPFWYQSARDPTGYATWKLYFFQHYYIFTTGICALVPLLFLTVHSLPILRHKAYELFALLHIPVSIAFVGIMFWHCHNYLTSWAYLEATIVIMLTSWILRLFYMNWMNPFRSSWLIGEECAVTILAENAVKVTIPTQKSWKPGQYIYLRMPGITFLENHPFTVTSLCSDDFTSEYGDQYRDMTLVFRPFGGFTKKVLDTAVRKGPYKTYRAYVDGPYGGMRRQMSSFDHVVFFAGGSGITAIASQLLDLIKRMRDGKATTAKVSVIWAMKRPEIMDWFKEELRICRECAPPDSITCQFFITAAKRRSQPQPNPTPRHSGMFGDRLNEKINDALQGVASKRGSRLMEDGPESELRDNITELPPQFLPPPKQAHLFPPADHRTSTMSNMPSAQNHSSTFDFGFPETPTNFQKSLMRFAFLPHHIKKDGWRTEYGRPDIPFILNQLAQDFGKRTCVFVCGPPSMRVDVANTVAALQTTVFTNPERDEIYMHAENYAI